MNIIIDGNAFLNVSVSIVKNILAREYGSSKNIGKTWPGKDALENYYVNDLTFSGNYSLKESSKEQFKKFSLNYLGSIFAPFKDNISSVFIVFDSRSWRKKFIQEHVDEHGEGDFVYKAGRKYDDKSHLFFDYFQLEILPTLVKEYGIHASKVIGAEGDDLIAYLCENLKGDICIWSVDSDLVQLLEDESRKVIMLTPKMQTKSKKIYTSDSFEKIEKKDVDLFNFDISSIDNSAVLNVLHDLLSKDYQHIKVNPVLEILTKILSGDTSDKIPRVHPKLTPGKSAKVIETVTSALSWSEIKSGIDSDDPEFIDLLVKVICETLKIVDPGETQTLRNTIGRNRTLIRLKTSVFPTDLVNSIKYEVDLSNLERFDYYKFKKNYYKA